MRKSVILMLSSHLALVACSGKSNDKQAPIPTATPTPVNQDEADGQGTDTSTSNPPSNRPSGGTGLGTAGGEISQEQKDCEANVGKQWLGGACIDEFQPSQVLFTPAAYCDEKPSGAFSNCQAAPHNGTAAVTIAPEPWTPSADDFFQELTFVSRITYIYFCPGGVMPAELVFNDRKFTLAQEEQEPESHTILNSIPLNSASSYQLKLAPVAFRTISRACRIAVTDNLSELDESSMSLLRLHYSQNPSEGVTSWLQAEQKRMEKRSDSKYALFLKTILD